MSAETSVLGKEKSVLVSGSIPSLSKRACSKKRKTPKNLSGSSREAEEKGSPFPIFRLTLKKGGRRERSRIKRIRVVQLGELCGRFPRGRENVAALYDLWRLGGKKKKEKISILAWGGGGRARRGGSI